MNILTTLSSVCKAFQKPLTFILSLPRITVFTHKTFHADSNLTVVYLSVVAQTFLRIVPIRGVAPVGDLFPVRGFNTRTFFCTNALQQSLSVSLAALCLRSLRLPPLPSPPLPLKHDTGFECDRLMIGCSALSPASLGVLDLSVSSCWGGGNLWLFTSPFSRYFEWVYFHNRVLTYFLCVPSVFLYFSSIIHLNGKLFISCMLYLLYPSVIVFIVFIVNKQTTSIPRTFEKLATPLVPIFPHWPL